MSRDDYEPVADRLARFWAAHPTGRITTSLEHVGDGWVIVAAQVYRSIDESAPSATGLAEETHSDRGVNALSYVENCETSAIGRALANLGFAPKGMAARPSREEMTKAARRSDPGENPATRPPAGQRRGLYGPPLTITAVTLVEAARAAGVDDINADLRRRGLPAVAGLTTDTERSAQLEHYRDLAKERAAAAEQAARQNAAAEEAGRA